jgi:hypothetical protein
MSEIKTTKLEWQETKNGVTIDCSLDIAIHPAQSNVTFVTIPGVDGSVDGYKNKYVDIADSVQQKHGVAVVRASNPFITSFHWESNIRRLLAYISENSERISGTLEPKLYIMAHSAGAAIIAQIAHEYPEIKRLLLINTAAKLDEEKIMKGVSAFKGEQVTILYGEHDPSVACVDNFHRTTTRADKSVEVLAGVDHNFSGNEGLETFVLAPIKYMFKP